LLAGELDHPVVHPDRRELAPARAARLGGLVLVVGEEQVEAPAVDVHSLVALVLGHRRALYVPAGTALAPGRGPGRVLALLAGLPEREVERVLLAVRSLHPLALIHVVDAAVRETAVAPIGADAEVDVAIGRVGVAAVDQRSDVLDDRPDRLRGLRLVVGAAEAERAGVRDVRVAHLRRQPLAPDALRSRHVVDLVVDVGDVDRQLDPVALVAQEAGEQAEDDERPGVADVDAAVDGRPAGVDPQIGFLGRRREPREAPLGRVVEQDLSHRRATLAAGYRFGACLERCRSVSLAGQLTSSSVATANAATPSPRPTKPIPSPVVALTLTYSGWTPSAPARLARIFSRCGASFGFSITTVESTLTSRSRRRWTIDITRPSRAIESASFQRSSVSGKWWPMSSRPAAPSRASITACVRTSASECPASPRSWGISTPPRISRRPSASRWESYPRPVRVTPAPPPGASRRARRCAPGARRRRARRCRGRRAARAPARSRRRRPRAGARRSRARPARGLRRT